MSEPKPKTIDAEFVEAVPRVVAGYGRRTVARPPGMADAAADVLEASAPLVDAVGNIAEAIGAESASEKAKGIAEMARAGAEVAREVPAAVAAIRQNIQPVKSAFGRLVEAAKRSGVVGERRAPVDFERVERKRGEK